MNIAQIPPSASVT